MFIHQDENAHKFTNKQKKLKIEHKIFSLFFLDKKHCVSNFTFLFFFSRKWETKFSFSRLLFFVFTFSVFAFNFQVGEFFAFVKTVRDDWNVNLQFPFKIHFFFFAFVFFAYNVKDDRERKKWVFLFVFDLTSRFFLSFFFANIMPSLFFCRYCHPHTLLLKPIIIWHNQFVKLRMISSIFNVFFFGLSC